MIAIPMQVAVAHVGIQVDVATTKVGLPVGIGASYQMRQGEIYSGSYVFTPTQATQTVPTADKLLLDNITINPIPNNYGLITYNGAYITIT